MCSYVTQNVDVAGYADSLELKRIVVALDHPRFVDAEHAVCVDLRAENGDPSARVSVELDVGSARRLATAILQALNEG